MDKELSSNWTTIPMDRGFEDVLIMEKKVAWDGNVVLEVHVVHTVTIQNEDGVRNEE